MQQAKDPRHENAKYFRRLLLFLTTALGLGGPILFGLVTAPQGGGERQAEKAAGNAREFEVASIKPSKSDAATMTYTAYGIKAITFHEVTGLCTSFPQGGRAKRKSLRRKETVENC